MEPFIRHEGIVVPLDRVNVDTDAIVPKQFLKGLERKGLGKILFYDWRYLDNGQENEEFPLNQPRYQGATILLTRANFGCGSSREHAPWALLDYGFKVIIAPSFADIFYNNCFKNGILPVILDEQSVDELFKLTEANVGFRLTIDLEQRLVSAQDKFQAKFQVSELLRYRLINGLDDITATLKLAHLIEQFEQKRPTWLNPST